MLLINSRYNKIRVSKVITTIIQSVKIRYVRTKVNDTNLVALRPIKRKGFERRLKTPLF